MKKVAIIGAGINGLMCAYYLSRQGVQVTVIDKGPIPNPVSASYGLHRLIHPWSANGCQQIASNAIRALGLWKNILADIKSDSFVQTGVVAVDEEQAAGFEGLPMALRRLKGDAVQDALPFGTMPRAQSATLFSDFGYLLAAQIMQDLAGYLTTQGVQFRADCAISGVDTQGGQLHLLNGAAVAFDHVIIAAGTGTGELLGQGAPFGDTIFSTRRCYVVYVRMPAKDSSVQAACWASLGTGDLWGMAAVGDLPMKIGSGTFTHPNNADQPDDADVVGQKIMAQYVAMFPDMARASILRAACNHWTAISGPRGHINAQKATLVTSDNGGGFKFAPLIASNIAQDIVDHLR